MMKDLIRWLSAFAIVLLAYLLAVAVIPFPTVAECFISFGFTLIAFAVTAVALYIAFLKKPNAKSRFYGFPLAKLAVIYFAAQLVLGFVFMGVGPFIPWWISVVVFTVLLAAAALGLISTSAVVAEIEQQDRKLKKDVALMRGLQSKVKQMASQCADAETAKAVQGFAEELRYSDPVSSAALAAIERDLSAAVDELQSAIVDGDSAATGQLCRRASAVLAERNRLCKLNKN